MARPSNTEARRREITGALRRVMARKGYEGASVADIAAAARLAPGLVHYHFDNKLEILLALLDELAAQHRERLEAALESAGTNAPARVAAFIDFHLSMQSADPDALACWITLSGEALREPRVKRRYREVVARWVGVLSEVLAAGARRKELRVPDPAPAACAVVAAIQGYFVLAAVDRTLIPRGTAAGAVRRMASGLLSLRRPLPRRT
jgi:TetR/AcrR family transcriptional regulator, transcriptional repressor of bet genes